MFGGSYLIAFYLFMFLVYMWRNSIFDIIVHDKKLIMMTILA